jgi:hypothetical protein
MFDHPYGHTHTHAAGHTPRVSGRTRLTESELSGLRPDGIVIAGQYKGHGEFAA